MKARFLCIVPLLLFFLATLPEKAVSDEFVISDESDATDIFITIEEDPDSEKEKEPQKIVITGKLEAPDPRSIPGQITIISAEEIITSAPKNLADIIEPVLGVAIVKYGGAASPSFVSIRGSSAEQVLVLLDGKRINSAQGGGVDLSTIDPASIERIEVHRGGSSAIFGDNAVGGVINIILKKAEPKLLSGSVRTGYASFNTIFGSASISSASQDTSLSGQAAVSALSSEGNYSFKDDNLGELERENADIRRLSASGAISYDPLQNLGISLDGSFYMDDRGVPGTIEFPTDSDRIRDEREHIAIALNLKTDSGEAVIEAAGVRQVRDYSIDRHDNRMLELESRYTGTVGSNNLSVQWLGGYSYRRDSLDSSAFTSNGGELYAVDALIRNRHAFFARSTINLFPYTGSSVPRLSFFPSARLDIWEQGYQPSWKFGVVAPFNENESVVFKLSGGTSYRTPSFDDLFWPATAFAVGNPDLEPETAIFADGGVVIKPISSLQIEASGFVRSVENLIQWTPGPNGWRPINIGESLFWGIESEMKTLIDLPSISSYLEAGINGNYLVALDRTEGTSTYNKTIPRKPVWQTNIMATITHSSGHSLRGEFRHTGIRFITAANTKWFHPYSVFDLALTLAAGERTKFLFSIKNLFNISYVDLQEYPIPGIELSAKVRYAF